MNLFAKKNNKDDILEEDELRLTELEMKELELHQTRADMNAAILEKLNYKERLMKIEQAQQLNGLRQKAKEAMVSLESARNDYNQTRNNVATRLNINLDNYIVQDSGVLIVSPEEENSE